VINNALSVIINSDSKILFVWNKKLLRVVIFIHNNLIIFVKNVKIFTKVQLYWNNALLTLIPS